MAFSVMPSCALRPRLTRKPGRLLQSSLALARRRRGAAPWFVPSARALPRLLGVPGRRHPRLCRSSLLPHGRASQKASCSCEATVTLSLPSSSPSSVTTGTRGPSPRALPRWFLPCPRHCQAGEGGLESVFLILPGERRLHLGGVLHHAGGERRGALWKGTVRIGRQRGGLEKYSEWKQGLLPKINGERMTHCLWKIPFCGKSLRQREGGA